jgi:hypothetical protein
MSAVIPNVKENSHLPVAPTRIDGYKYRYELITPYLRIYADTPTELCESLIAGYSEAIGAEDLLYELRLRYSVATQVQLQAFILAEADLSTCTASEIALMGSPRDTPPHLTVWEADVPLVLVESYYEPDGNLPRPTGFPRSGKEPESNLIWLNPSEELTFLWSLHFAGVLTLAELQIPEIRALK